VRYYKSMRRWECKNQHPKHQFSIKNGTIFGGVTHRSGQMARCHVARQLQERVSSSEIHRATKVTQETAWFMMHRIRRATEQGSFGKLSGEIEANEMFIGGKANNMHVAKRTTAHHWHWW